MIEHVIEIERRQTITIISFFILPGVCLSDLNLEIMRIKRPKTIPIPNIKVSWEIKSGGVINAATIEKTSKRGCEINCVNGHRIVKLFSTKGILWLTEHRNN